MPGTTTISTLRQDAVSQGLRYAPITFDHHWCINSGFITENLGPLLMKGSRSTFEDFNP
jgi:hypothetical protein